MCFGVSCTLKLIFIYIICFARAVKKRSRETNFLQALNNPAVILDRLGRHGTAEARHRQALHLTPENTEVRFNLVTRKHWRWQVSSLNAARFRRKRNRCNGTKRELR